MQSKTSSTTLNADTATTVTVAFDDPAICSEFAITSPMTAVTVDVGAPQTVTVKFMPTSAGSKSCMIDVKDSGNATITSFTATGTAVAPTPQAISVNTNTLSFGHVDVAVTSTTQSVTATNTGDTTLTITSGTFTAGSS